MSGRCNDVRPESYSFFEFPWICMTRMRPRVRFPLRPLHESPGQRAKTPGRSGFQRAANRGCYLKVTHSSLGEQVIWPPWRPRNPSPNAAGQLAWRVRYYDVHGKQRHATLPSENAANRFLDEMRKKKEQGLSADPAPLRRSLNEWADEYFADEAKTSYTVQGYEDAKQKYNWLARPVLGEDFLVKIGRDRIEAWCKDIIVNAGLKRTTAIGGKTVVSKVIEYAHRQCRCTDRPNPTKGARLPREIQQVVDGEDELEETDYWLFHPLDFDEIDELADAITAPKYAGIRKPGLYQEIAARLEKGMSQRPSRKSWAWLPGRSATTQRSGEKGRPRAGATRSTGPWSGFMAFTGVRIGELCALRVMDIDLKAPSVRVRHSIAEISKETAAEMGLEGTRIRKPTKSENVRTVPIASHLVAEIEKLIEGKAAKALLSHRPPGWPPVGPELPGRLLQARCRGHRQADLHSSRLAPHLRLDADPSQNRPGGGSQAYGSLQPQLHHEADVHLFQGRAEEAISPTRPGLRRTPSTAEGQLMCFALNRKRNPHSLREECGGGFTAPTNTLPRECNPSVTATRGQYSRPGRPRLGRTRNHPARSPRRSDDGYFTTEPTAQQSESMARGSGPSRLTTPVWPLRHCGQRRPLVAASPSEIPNTTMTTGSRYARSTPTS